MMKRTTLLLSIALVSSVVFLSGCFSANPKDIAAWKKPYEVNVTTDKYILQPADQIQITCPTVADINFPAQTIRPDGKITFPNIGEVEVAGKTPLEAAAAVREKASKLYVFTGEHPIDVRIVVYQSHVYYVLGMVARPGPRLYSGRSSALRALADAQPNVMAWGDHIQVIRPSSDPKVKPKIFAIEWDPMVAHGKADKDVLLEEGDIIYVPPTVLARIGLTIAEFLSPFTQVFSAVNNVGGAGTGAGVGY
jgi:polysaccharide export outer membrane protein